MAVTSPICHRITAYSNNFTAVFSNWNYCVVFGRIDPNWYIVFFKLEESVVSSLRWPWTESDGNGEMRLLLAYAVFLIPSALWIESTILHMENDYAWTQYLVIGMLLFTSIGNIMLGLLAFGAYQDGIDGSTLMITGAIMLAIQCILNDFVIWVYRFPW